MRRNNHNWRWGVRPIALVLFSFLIAGAGDFDPTQELSAVDNELASIQLQNPNLQETNPGTEIDSARKGIESAKGQVIDGAYGNAALSAAGAAKSLEKALKDITEDSLKGKLLDLAQNLRSLADKLSVGNLREQLTADSGLHTATIQTLHGNVVVNLPEDMEAGDTISGTVYVVNPVGKTDQERQKNTDELNGTVVEVEGQKASVGKGFLKWAVPAGLAGGLATMLLMDNQGHTLGTTKVPVAPPPTTSPPSNTSTPTGPHQPGDYHLPRLGQSGHSVAVTGPFDGDLSNTDIRLGDDRMTVDAESPREAIFQVHSDTVGSKRLRVEENGIVAEGEFNVLKLSVTAPKTKLLKGEKTDVTVRVEGLSGLPANEYPIDIALAISKESQKTIAFEDMQGPILRHSIAMKEVGTGGVFNLTATVIGVNPGEFRLIAIMLSPFFSIDVCHCPDPGGLTPVGASLQCINANWGVTISLPTLTTCAPSWAFCDMCNCTYNRSWICTTTGWTRNPAGDTDTGCPF